MSSLLDHLRPSYPYNMQNKIKLHLKLVQGQDQLKQGSAFGCSLKVSSFRILIVSVPGQLTTI
jgi:hypothetical protein